MATKPQTYPQQIQELKAELEEKNEQLNEALQKLSFVEEMQNEIAHLNAQLAARSKEDRQGAVNDKAQWTDLEQRAISAEQGLRNSQALVAELQAIRQSLEVQLRAVAIERDKEVGKDKKLIHLEEIIRDQNFEIAKGKQQYVDLKSDSDATIGNLQRQIREWKESSEFNRQRLQDVLAKLAQADLSKLLGL